MDETNIRDFCASYCELYDADNGGRRSSNTVDILIRQAVHMSNRLNELEHTTLHQWAIDNFIDHPPIRKWFRTKYPIIQLWRNNHLIFKL
jgi:hypothetical protein